ncbi:MAG: hypothetical protein PHE17_04470 [Thiothrix sp.]|uniref:hypothetical protein n=1 Tax=Thiothrix sp. TaxID=1032 RepID=UPI00260CE8EF|nr:hypothetical protein [Thiothrix sp.]MDD5392253.1 hypothetical protein [Thiothrix sp.]
MTAGISSGTQNRKDRMARAIGILIMVLGGGLIGISWLFQQNANSNPTPITQAEEFQPAPPRPILPAKTSMPPKSLAVASTQDKPLPDTAAVIPVNANTAWPSDAPPETPKTKPTEPALETAATKPAEPAAAITDKPADPIPTTTSTKTGWIYAGQFTDGAWIERGLVIGDELPVSGQSYALNWGANIRSQPPGKTTELSENVGYLAQGHNVEIVQVKKSGSKGHVWLEIKR